MAYGRGQRPCDRFEMMLDVIADQNGLGFFERHDDGKHLLGDRETIAIFLDHGDNAAEMTMSALEPIEQLLIVNMGHQPLSPGAGSNVKLSQQRNRSGAQQHA